eukprot:symbB.v1.2.012945.t1/scaffold872.1/size254027/5
MALVDCHCHLTSEKFDHDFEAVLARASRANVAGILVCSTSPADIHRVIQMRRQYPKLHICLGLHPLDDSFNEKDWNNIRSIIANEHLDRGITALGEIGLDFSRPLLRQKAQAQGSSEAMIRAQQVQCFEAQLQLAKELQLPVNVHSRNAEAETLEILARYDVPGVMHAYKGPAQLALQAAGHGRLFFSFPPSLVYKREYQDAVMLLPLERLLLETDSPSLAAKGPKARNEPAFVRQAAEKMAELKKVSLDEVVKATTRNALQLFPELSKSLLEELATIPARNGRSQPRWRRDSCATELSVPAPRVAGHTEVKAPQRRWSRRSPVSLDPTLCTSAYGGVGCD